MNRRISQDWLHHLPPAFEAYRGGRRIEEVECIIPDFFGRSRGKAMPSYKFSPEQRFYMPVSIFYQTLTGIDVELDIKDQWAEKDMVLVPDMNTACAVPWADDVSMQVIADLQRRDGEPIPYAPRNVLRRVLGFYDAQGWKPVVAPELEFYLTTPNIDPNEPIVPPIGRTGRRGTSRQSYSMMAVDEYGPVIDMIYDYAEVQGLTIDTMIQEDGAGQIEINLPHGDPMHLADEVFYFKRSIREAALKNGMFATFMAKPMRDQPGSAMHLHQSVVDAKSNRNIFTDSNGENTEAFYNFIGGQQTYLLQVMPLVAPYVNSFRRYEMSSSAPTNIAWGVDNRATGLRVPVSPPEARRVENRLIGTDCNPYLAIAASLASGLLGIEQGSMPTDPLPGGPEAGVFELPPDLGAALDAFDGDATADIRRMIGDEFCNVYAGIKREELWDFQREISPWEREHLLLNV